MAMALSRFSHWIWPGGRTRRTRKPPAGSAAVSNASFPDIPSGFQEVDAVRLPSSAAAARGSPPRKAKNCRRRRRREEARIDREHDMVIVPSDGDESLSDTDSDDSDWSIGWLEPQGPELQSDGDSEGSFAVLVPCYRHSHFEEPGQSDGRFPGPGGLAGGSLSDGKIFVEQWLSSLQN